MRQNDPEKMGGRGRSERLPAVRMMAEALRDGAAGGRERPRVFIGTLNVFTAPARVLSEPLARRYDERYRGKYRFARQLFYVDIGLLAVAAALLASALALFLLPASAPPLAVRIEASPASPRNGDPVTFLVRVSNRGPGELDDARLSLRFPPQFRILSAPDGYDAASGAIPLGALPEGATRAVGITAAAFATEASPREAKVFAVLSGARRGTATEYAAERRLVFRGSAVTASIGLPERLAAGERTDVPLSVRNGGSVPVGPLTVRTCARGALVIADAVEECIEESIPLLGPGSAVSTTIRAVAGAGEEAPGLAVRVTMDIDGARALLTEEEARSALIDPGAALVIGFTEGTAQEDGASADIPVALTRLAPGASIENLSVVAALPDGGEATVASADSAMLASFLATKTLWLTAKFPKEVHDTATLTAVAMVVSGGGRREARSAPLILPLPPRAAMDASARYWSPEGEQLGRGPIPPTVGEETEYWLFWDVGPAARALGSVEVSARLGPGVRWVGKQTVGIPDAGPVTYSPATRTVRWRVRDLDAATAGQGIGLAFAVAITPSNGDRGTEPTLLGETVLRLVTADGASASASASAVTTALLADERAAGKGTVR